MTTKAHAEPGATIETAIVIIAPSENAHLERIFGDGWVKRWQMLIRFNNRHYDAIVIEKGRRTEKVYFDINSFLPVPPEEGA